VYSVLDTQVSLLRASVELLVGDADGTWTSTPNCGRRSNEGSVGHAPIPPHTGGVETHVEAVATTLVERGHDVTVYSTDAGSDVASRTEQAGVAIQRFNAVNPGDAFYVAPRLIPAVRQADADIVHAHNVHALPLLFTTLAVGGQPLIATPHYHGASANGIRDLLLRAYRPAAKSALGRANAVVAVSDWEASLLKWTSASHPPPSRTA